MFEKYKAIKQAEKAAKIEAEKKYKEALQMEQAKKELLTSKSDFSLLEKLIQKINNNPDLKVDIRLLDGTTIHIQTVEQKTVNQTQDDWINDAAFVDVYK